MKQENAMSFVRRSTANSFVDGASCLKSETYTHSKDQQGISVVIKKSTYVSISETT